jgi:hypothetical protein
VLKFNIFKCSYYIYKMVLYFYNRPQQPLFSINKQLIYCVVEQLMLKDETDHLKIMLKFNIFRCSYYIYKMVLYFYNRPIKPFIFNKKQHLLLCFKMVDTEGKIISLKKYVKNINFKASLLRYHNL